ncbi:hypothetical protein MGN70_003374 [Eutypa lata]|nr:hypothetical protein MGN70_003374 [Eutypa lata]
MLSKNFHALTTNFTGLPDPMRYKIPSIRGLITSTTRNLKNIIKFQDICDGGRKPVYRRRVVQVKGGDTADTVTADRTEKERGGTAAISHNPTHLVAALVHRSNKEDHGSSSSSDAPTQQELELLFEEDWSDEVIVPSTDHASPSSIDHLCHKKRALHDFGLL